MPEAFLKKYASAVVEKTVIGMMESPQVLFTTWGIHFVNVNKESVAISYKDIDFAKTTITRNDHGLPSGVYLRTKGNSTQFYLPLSQAEEFLELLQEASQMDTADSDSIILMKKMPDEVKLVYGELLILFCQQCELDWIEAVRCVNELKMSKDTFDTFMVYAYRRHADYELSTLTEKLKALIPYPNEESVAYALIQSLVPIIQFSSSRCRSLTVKETGCLDEIAALMGINKEVVDKLIPVAQIPYRILKQDIEEKEISALGQTLATVTAGVGLPVATVLGSSFLFWNIWWFMFIPGIGTTLAAGALGVAAVTALFGNARKKEVTRKKEAAQEQLTAAKKSYLSLYRTVQNLPQSENLSSLVLKAAVRADVSVGEYLQGEISKDKRIAEKRKAESYQAALERERKINCISELKIYNAIGAEQKHLFRTTAMAKYAPVHVGDLYSLLADGKITDRTIKIAQISFSGLESVEAGKTVTIFVEADGFTMGELSNTTWVKAQDEHIAQ